MLERIYMNLKEYDKAIAILQKLQMTFPDIGDVQNEINKIMRMKQMEQHAN
jgi:hypothetical protein